MKEEMMFEELNDEQLCNTEGGAVWLAAAGIIAAAAASCFIYEVANEKCKRDTGYSIGENIANTAGSALETIGGGLQTVGEFID